MIGGEFENLFSPDDLAVLTGAFQDVCARCGIKPEQADDVLALVFDAAGKIGFNRQGIVDSVISRAEQIGNAYLNNIRK